MGPFQPRRLRESHTLGNYPVLPDPRWHSGASLADVAAEYRPQGTTRLCRAVSRLGLAVVPNLDGPCKWPRSLNANPIAIAAVAFGMTIFGLVFLFSVPHLGSS